MTEGTSPKRIEISTTISTEDKEFLDRIGIIASSALSMGVLVIRISLGLVSESSHRVATPSEADIDVLIKQRIASLQRIMDSTPWKSIDEIAAYFGKKKTTLHGLEEVKDEEDQNAP